MAKQFAFALFGSFGSFVTFLLVLILIGSLIPTSVILTIEVDTSLGKTQSSASMDKVPLFTYFTEKDTFSISGERSDTEYDLVVEISGDESEETVNLFDIRNKQIEIVRGYKPFGSDDPEDVSVVVKIPQYGYEEVIEVGD